MPHYHFLSLNSMTPWLPRAKCTAITLSTRKVTEDGGRGLVVEIKWVRYVSIYLESNLRYLRPILQYSFHTAIYPFHTYICSVL